jgi:hypothetical protein
MPSTSAKQHKFMEAVAHSPSFAKKVGVPQSVGKDFSKADKGKTFKQGGEMATTKMGKPVMKAGMSTAKDGMKKPTPMAKTAMAGMMGMKKGGNVTTTKMGKVVAGGMKGKGEHTVQKKALTKGKNIKM